MWEVDRRDRRNVLTVEERLVISSANDPCPNGTHQVRVVRGTVDPVTLHPAIDVPESDRKDPGMADRAESPRRTVPAIDNDVKPAASTSATRFARTRIGCPRSIPDSGAGIRIGVGDGPATIATGGDGRPGVA